MSTFDGKPFAEMSVTEKMRAVLRPGGTLPVVRLHLNGDGAFMDEAFVQRCITELERMPVRVALGEPPTDLEKLAYLLLCDSAYIPIDKAL